MSEETKNLIKEACKRLTGYKRRAYQAHITMEYFDGSPYRRVSASTEKYQ